MSEELQQSVKKTITKRVREVEVVVSDRMRLVEAASEFCRCVMNKEVMPMCNSSMLGLVELSDPEKKAYESALDFLRRQFESGYSETEPHDKRIETEETTEF